MLKTKVKILGFIIGIILSALTFFPSNLSADAHAYCQTNCVGGCACLGDCSCTAWNDCTCYCHYENDDVFWFGNCTIKND